MAPDDESSAPRPPAAAAVKEPLPIWVRIGLFLAGWLLVLIGIAGLALPGIQGILTILLGGALLSLVSETFYKLMRRMFSRWPKLWERLDGWRDRLHRWLHPKRGRGAGD